MATVGNAVTMAEMAKREDPNGVIADIVELLTEKNEILEDMLIQEGNLPTGHRTTVRTGLPSATWRLLNYGVQPSKSKTKQIDDTCGMLEAYAEVDKALADLNNNTAAFRLSEDRAFLEAMNQEMAKTLFYGDTRTHPERFVGLAPRYNDMSADSGENIVDGGGTGSDNCSIWVVSWGDNTIHGITPKGSKTGFQHRDLGEVTLEDAAGGKYQGYRTHYKWDLGMTVRDWRYAVRVANIDVSELSKDPSTSGANISDLLVQALERLQDQSTGRPAIYCTRRIRTILRRQLIEKSNVNLTFDTAAGKRILAFDGVPVRRVDQLLETEAQIS